VIKLGLAQRLGTAAIVAKRDHVKSQCGNRQGALAQRAPEKQKKTTRIVLPNIGRFEFTTQEKV
jgi:hypothetical protein